MAAWAFRDASSLDVEWQKSSASGKEGDCVELAPYQGTVAIRDSKVPHGPAILYSRASVVALVAGIKSGELARFTYDN
ncbi:DUF397 domain-containing protein [Streptomyces sp. NPDC087425]|uniref:DUF397 domain-containing protein n=1 Tax=Streptomyces sp. NPDC087425 TaxID=3365787 RepID=UPI0038015349